MNAAKSYSLSALAELLQVELRGDGALQITGVSGIESARPGQLSFVANPRYAAKARSTQASVLLVTPDFEELTVPTLRTPDPYLAFAKAAELFYSRPVYPPGIHPTAVIDPSAVLGRNIHIGPYVVVMSNVVVGDESVVLAHSVLYSGVHAGARLLMHAHAIVREACVLGDDVVLQNGVVVGGDGFGFARRPDGSWHKIPQAGRVVVGDAVEIQANACVDRASLGETTIARGAKIDNLVQVGHGSYVGENTLLCAQVGLAGSSKIGKSVILAGQVGVAGHCTVGDGVTATAQSGIPNDVAPGVTVSGYPAVENRRWLKNTVIANRLADEIRNLKRERK